MNEKKRHFVAGSLSGFMVRFLTQPFDVLKIRFQLQMEPIKRSTSSYYWSLPHAFSRIIREEGFTALWKGHIPGQLLSITFCGFEFGVFYGLATLPMFPSVAAQPPVFRDLLFGVIAGTVATACCQPWDVMRTRLIAQGQQRVYSGFICGIKDLIAFEGVLALWRGLGPSCILIAPQTGITFAVYENLKRTYVAHYDPDSDAAPSHFTGLLFGSVSGIVAKTAVYPLDLIKKRLAVRGFESARRPFGQLLTSYTASSYKLALAKRSQAPRTQLYASWACFRGILAQEGFLGLFKGWSPSALKAACSTGLTFFFFEYFRTLFEISV